MVRRLSGCPAFITQLDFRKAKNKKALLDSGSKINIINPAFAQKLGLHIRKTHVRAQKIDGSVLKTFGIVIADLEVENKDGRSRFFQKTFLVAGAGFEAVLEISFLKISNADVSFGEKTLTWKSCTTINVLPTTK